MAVSRANAGGRGLVGYPRRGLCELRTPRRRSPENQDPMHPWVVASSNLSDINKGCLATDERDERHSMFETSVLGVRVSGYY